MSKSNKQTEGALAEVARADLLDRDLFETWHKRGDSHLIGLRIEGNRKITVLDRMTGWGNGMRDIESGYTDETGKFWLASGNFDVTKQGEITVEKAIELIKANANTCVGV